MFSQVEMPVEEIFIHQENKFDDFQQQILLPHRMSQFGPALAVADINSDGLEDYYVGGAKDQAGALYIQNKDGSFNLQDGPWTTDRESEDVRAMFFDSDGDGDQDLYVVSGGMEFDLGSEQYQDRLYINEKGSFSKAIEALPPMRVSTGAVAAGDFDGDGDQDLFVGGRVKPHRYPSPVSSYLLRNDGGKFVDISSQSEIDFGEFGMVTDAMWINLNDDNTPELVVVGEWMGVRVFCKWRWWFC